MEKRKTTTKNNKVKKKGAVKKSSASKSSAPKRSTTKKTVSVENSVIKEEVVKQEEKITINKTNKFKDFFTKRNIIIISIILIIVIVFCIFIFKKNNNTMSYYINDNNLRHTTKLTFDTKKDYRVANKYGLKNDRVYLSNEDVLLKDLHGKIGYIKGNELKANIYQSYEDINKKIEGIPTLIILSQYMDAFENNCLKEMNIPLNIEMKEHYHGMRKFKFKLSPEEAILKEGREYSKSFKYKSNKYEFNYYINGDNFVCEFVRFL